MKFLHLSLVYSFLLIILYCSYGTCASSEKIQQIRRNKRSYAPGLDPNGSTGEEVENLLSKYYGYEHSAIKVITTAAPTTAAPTTAASTTAAPTTATNTTEAPTTAAPTTAAPTTAAPTTETPTTAAPTTPVSKTTRSLDEVMRPYYPYKKK